MNLSPWDVAASSLIVTEAGGVVLPFRDDRKLSIVAGNPVISRKILDALREVDRLA